MFSIGYFKKSQSIDIQSLAKSSYHYFKTYGFEGGVDYFIGALYKANATRKIKDLH